MDGVIMMIRGFLLLFMVWLACPVWAEQGPVVALLSDTEEAYEQPLAQFKNALNHSVVVFNLQGDIQSAPERMKEVLAEEPSLIFALGAKAAFFAKAATTRRQDIPVLFAMVLNWQRYHLMEGQNNVAGISTEVADGTQLLSLSLIFPELVRLGVFYNPEYSFATVEKAIKAADLVGLEVVAQPITRGKDLKRAYRRLVNQVDAILLPNDPVLYTVENVLWLNRQCLKDRVICIGQSDNLARIGLLLAVNPDIPSVGGQAAVLAKAILQHKMPPAEVGVRNPLGTRLILNARTAQKIGLKLTDDAIQLADEVIR
jgi:ABC-type uncharacterized transport system substrate-binding protein